MFWQFVLLSIDFALVLIYNRLWQHHFGAGLVRTPEDFGSRVKSAVFTVSSRTRDKDTDMSDCDQLRAAGIICHSSRIANRLTAPASQRLFVFFWGGFLWFLGLLGGVEAVMGHCGRGGATVVGAALYVRHRPLAAQSGAEVIPSRCRLVQPSPRSGDRVVTLSPCSGRSVPPKGFPAGARRRRSHRPGR